jgi:hypothetical protein
MTTQAFNHDASGVTHATPFTPSIIAVQVSLGSHLGSAGEAVHEMALRGRAEPGGRVIVQSGEQRLGTALVNGQGEWSLAGPAQNPGTHCVSVIAVSAYGLEGAFSQSYEVRLDGETATLSPVTALPGASLPEPLAALVQSAIAPVEAAGDAVIAQVRAPDSPAAGREPEAETGLALTDALAVEPDAEPTSQPVPDTQASAVQPHEPPQPTASPGSASISGVVNDTADGGKALHQGDATHDRTPTLHGRGEPGSRIVVQSNDEAIGATWVDETGFWRFTTSELAYGEHQISVVAIDLAGAISAVSPPFLILIEPVLIVGSVPSIEPVVDTPVMTTWEQWVQDGVSVIAPAPSLVFHSTEPVLDFSWIDRLSTEAADAAGIAPSLALATLLSDGSNELFQPTASVADVSRDMAAEFPLIDDDSQWAGLDSITTAGVEHSVAAVSPVQLDGEDNNVTPLI